MDIKRMLSNNMPLILTVTGVTGVLSTTVLAVRATPAAVRDIQDAESERIEPLTALEKVKLTWRYYVPATIVGSATIAAIIGAQSINAKRQAAIAGVYALTEKAFGDYREKVIEKLGEKKEQSVREEIIGAQMDANPVTSKEVLITGLGEHRMFDSISARYFNSDIEAVRKAENDINALCINDMYASLNDFYRAIGLPITSMGDELGWTTDHMMELNFFPRISEDGVPSIGIEYRAYPIQGYYKVNH